MKSTVSPFPKLAQNFTVEVDNSLLQPLIKQLICIDMGAESLSESTIKHSRNTLVLWVQDDIQCEAMKAVRAWQQVQQLFTLSVTMLMPTSKPVENYIFINCRLEAIQHSMLNYNTGHDQIELKVKSPGEEMKQPWELTTLSGTVSRVSSDQTVMKLVQVGFDIMHHEFT